MALKGKRSGPTHRKRLGQSQMQLDEELDEVKAMNKHMMFGRVVSVRDKQLRENSSLEKEYVDE